MSAKILIVDDSIVARMSLKSILKDTELAIVEASSGEAALELLAGGLNPVIVFLDLTMAGMGGIEALRAIKASHPGLSVVIVTADIQTRTIESVTALGCAAVVRKPPAKIEILNALARFRSDGRPA